LLHRKFLLAATIVITAILISGCAAFQGLTGMFTPAPKPEVGPTGKPVESKPNPPLMERFLSPPTQLYDLEATAGVIFEGFNTEKWDQAQKRINKSANDMAASETIIGRKKGSKRS